MTVCKSNVLCRTHTMVATSYIASQRSIYPGIPLMGTVANSAHYRKRKLEKAVHFKKELPDLYPVIQGNLEKFASEHNPHRKSTMKGPAGSSRK